MGWTDFSWLDSREQEIQVYGLQVLCVGADLHILRELLIEGAQRECGNVDDDDFRKATTADLLLVLVHVDGRVLFGSGEHLFASSNNNNSHRAF